MDRIFSTCDYTLLCHYEYVEFRNRQIVCTHPMHSPEPSVIYNDINDYLKLLNPYQSICMAQIFAENTGIIDNLKCKFPVEDIPGVMPFRDDVFIYYDVLVQCIQMLGIMNSSFVDYVPASLFDKNATLNIKIVNGFIDRFTKMVKTQRQDENISDLIHTMLGHLVNVSKNTNSIITYFLDVYAPYVKQLNHTVPLGGRQVVSVRITVEKFKIINLNANKIRNAFSPYSLQFELMYVLVYTYMFMENLDVVTGILFKFLSQVFNGMFETVDREKYRRYLDQRLSKVRNNQGLLKRVRMLKDAGGFSSDISLSCLKDMEQIHKIYSPNFAQTFWPLDTPAEIASYAESQTFPSILFSDKSNADYFGYMLCYPILKQGFDPKTGTFMKNTVSQCKAICLFTRDFIDRFLAFEKDVEYWTMDMFQLFVGSDEKFQSTFQHFMDMFKK